MSSSKGKNSTKASTASAKKPAIINTYLKPPKQKQKAKSGPSRKTKQKQKPNSNSPDIQQPKTTRSGQATINEEDESGDISRTTTLASSASPTQVDTVSATDDDDDGDDDDDDDDDTDIPSVPEIPTTTGQRSRTHYPKCNKDLPSVTISAANLKLDSVYGNHVHENVGCHLHGGISAGEDAMWQARHKSLLPFNAWLYDVQKEKLARNIRTR